MTIIAEPCQSTPSNAWQFTAAAPTPHRSFPWWVVLLVIELGILGGVIYWRTR